MRTFFVRLGQYCQDRWRSFRAWQEHPVHYTLDEREHVCNNCGHTFTGNYCPVCSQSARQGRISWLALWQGIGQLWGIESRSAIYTLWQLLWRPGYLVRDYISGKRQVSYPPVKLLFILAAVVAVVQYFFPAPAKTSPEIGSLYIDLAVNWLDNHDNIGALLFGCMFIVPTWVLFRNAPRYPHHTIPEGFFLQVYLAILSFVVSSVFAGSNVLTIGLPCIYSYAAYKQLFGYGYWQTLWRWLLSIVWSLAILIAIITVGFLTSQALA